MLLRALGRRTLLPLTAATVLFSGGAVAQAASSVSLCVPSTPNTAVTSASSTGTCSSGTAVALPASSAAQQTLISILPDINYQASGIDGKPTIQFSGANLQVINGSGSETALNGEGNLVIGYDSSPGTQTGSHNLLLASSGQSDTEFGGIVVGASNTISGVASSVLGGTGNTALDEDSVVVGGCDNVTTNTSVTKVPLPPCYGFDEAILGGSHNQTASAINSTVSGGYQNTAKNNWSSVSGGDDNTAGGQYSAVTGGENNLASDLASSIAGGCDNLAGPGTAPSDTCVNNDEAVAGGSQNKASGYYAIVAGGESNEATDSASAAFGGCYDTAGGAPFRHGSCESQDPTTIGGNDDAAGEAFSLAAGGYENNVGYYNGQGPYNTESLFGGEYEALNQGNGYSELGGSAPVRP